jgi:benzoyl-CoA reductase/2-hydroxyglutaryl-CoA dehydratase subunit BcrC/BadD/HgdB
MELKQIGWFCSYTPIELIEAAGFAPYGIRVDSGHGHEDVYLGDSICSYVRSSIGGALAGSYDFLAGVVIAHSCECMRRLYDGWRFKQEDIGPDCIYFLDVPRVYNERSVAYFAKQLQRFREELERRYGPIPEERLIESIKKYNFTRDLYNRLLELRKQDNPPISGVEVARLIRENLIMPRDEFNRTLESFLDERKGSAGNAGPRIMIYGGPGNPSLAELVEGAGGIVVYENMCNGLRQDDTLVGFDEGPLMGLSRRYLGKNPCPRMLGPHADYGLNELKHIVDLFRIDGIIYHSIKFCANLHSVAGIIKNEFNVGVPVKIIEGDISSEIDEREIRSFIKNLGLKARALKEGMRR